MSFIQKIIGPDERLVGVCSAHWIYGLKGLFWLIGFVALGSIIKNIIGSEQLFNFVATTAPSLGNLFLIIGQYAFMTCTFIGVMLFLCYFSILISMEIGLTTQRVIFKRGLIMVSVREIDIEEIKGADVNNGWFGRFFNYGYLIFDARFITNLELPAIGDPYRFVKALNENRARLKTDSMKVVLDGPNTIVDVDTEAAPTQRPRDEIFHPVQHPKDKQGQPASMESERYDALSDNPVTEIGRAAQEAWDLSAPYMPPVPREPESQSKRQKSSKRLNYKHLKPMAMQRMEMRKAFKERFHMIARYGNQYPDTPSVEA